MAVAITYNKVFLPFGSQNLGYLMKDCCHYFKRKENARIRMIWHMSCVYNLLQQLLTGAYLFCVCSYNTGSMSMNVPYRQQQKRQTPDTISVLFINRTGSRWERKGRLKEEAMAFNFLKGARPATPLQLLFIRRPVIPSGLVSSYRLSFKHTVCLPQQRQRVPIQYTSTISTSMSQLHINVTGSQALMTIISRGAAVEVLQHYKAK